MAGLHWSGAGLSLAVPLAIRPRIKTAWGAKFQVAFGGFRIILGRDSKLQVLSRKGVDTGECSEAREDSEEG
ncbi:hypothetical protein OG21DRAFT_1512293 [Imleria badia]|nr:hypothetical protein OG21DRAFT_1512293 [Imleria badia]